MGERRGLTALRFAVLAGALALVPCTGSAADCAPPATVRFAPGASAAEVEGGVPRGMRDCFLLQAGKGQTLAITQPHPVDDNIVFQIYQPRWTIHRTDAGWAFGGSSLPGTEETRDTRAWTGTLPESGGYLLVVGTSRGGGTYRLRIEIR